MPSMKVKKGDLVQMLTGKDRGKQGHVVDARPRELKVMVENLNLATRHQKPKPMRDASRMGGTQMTPGGRVEKPTLVPVGNVMVVCPTCKLPSRIGYKTKESQGRDDQGARLQARRLWPGARQIMATTTETYVPRLKQSYNDELRPQLKDQLGLKSIMQVPRITKVTLNMGVGEAKTEAKVLDAAIEELTIIAGQRAQVRKAKKSVASFKLREGMPIGARVTLRGDRMWEFIDRLISIALPRIRDFRGLNPGSFDGRGNYSLGIREQIIFPEIDYDSINTIRGLDVAITTTAETDEQAEALLRGLGFPLATEEQQS